jgi:phosphatidylglycerol:prolipoprotein diacylglycerol transferase
MNLQSPGSVLIKLGPVTIRWYGMMIALGALVAINAATRLAKRWGIDSEKIVSLALTCFLGGIVGARLYYVALSWQYFSTHLIEILFSPTEGLSIRGLSIHGGIIGALICGYFYCRRANLPMLRCCDLISACVPLAQAIGRWGNFFNSEAFGRPVPDQFPFKLFIPEDQRPMQFINYKYFHPTFLYESVWDLMLFGILYFYVANKLRRYPGMSFLIFIAGYSVGRLLIEPLRTDSIMMPGFDIPAPSIVSAIMLLMALIAIALLASRGPKNPQETASPSEVSQNEAANDPQSTAAESSKNAQPSVHDQPNSP